MNQQISVHNAECLLGLDRIDVDLPLTAKNVPESSSSSQTKGIQAYRVESLKTARKARDDQRLLHLQRCVPRRAERVEGSTMGYEHNTTTRWLGGRESLPYASIDTTQLMQLVPRLPEGTGAKRTLAGLKPKG